MQRSTGERAIMKSQFSHLKPRSGCLFKGDGTEPELSFCFSAARTWARTNFLAGNSELLGASSSHQRLAAEKQKDDGLTRVAAINRQPLRGLKNGAFIAPKFIAMRALIAVTA